MLWHKPFARSVRLENILLMKVKAVHPLAHHVKQANTQPVVLGRVRLLSASNVVKANIPTLDQDKQLKRCASLALPEPILLMKVKPVHPLAHHVLPEDIPRAKLDESVRIRVHFARLENIPTK